MKKISFKTKKPKMQFIAVNQDKKTTADKMPKEQDVVSVKTLNINTFDSEAPVELLPTDEKGVFTAFFGNIKKKRINAFSYSVYINGSYLYGDVLETASEIDNYRSYLTPVVITAADGLICNRDVRSRFVAKIEIKNRDYVVAVSSYQYECFKGRETELVDCIKQCKRDLEVIIQ